MAVLVGRSNKPAYGPCDAVWKPCPEDVSYPASSDKYSLERIHLQECSGTDMSQPSLHGCQSAGCLSTKARGNVLIIIKGGVDGIWYQSAW